MDVSIFGLGYVGCVSAGCLANQGHNVVGVDINPRKVTAINQGETPVDEPGLDELIASGAREGRLTATTDAPEAIRKSRISFISVGTPPGSDGQLDTTNLYNVMDSIAQSIDSKDHHTVVVRSTVPPGTTRKLRSYLLEQIDSKNITFLSNPEFLREGSAIDDFYDPPYVVVGNFEDGDPEPLITLYEALSVDGNVHVVSPELAESLKLVNNTFHALKIVFANEIGSLASQYDMDGKKLMELVCADSKLNISPKYLEPGLPFGGACLPKDSQATAKLGDVAEIDLPLIDNIPVGNRTHFDRIISYIEDLNGMTVGIVGISFKHGTTDLRNSPALEISERLDKDTLMYTPGLELGSLVGANRDYIDQNYPDIKEQIVENQSEFLSRCDTLLFPNFGDYDQLVREIEDQIVVDPIGAVANHREQFVQYETVTW